jgi:glyoxylase-like metal-dependent hydrolase (beta-lactamase superfamily II)
MVTRFEIGKIELFRVVEFEGPLLGVYELFPDAKREILENHLEWLVPRFYAPETEQLVTTIQGFLIKTPSLNVLVDTCSGSLKNRNRRIFHQKNWPWLETLSSHGVSTEDIDIVICTHLHVDHVGWNTKIVDGEWLSTFPKAQYLITQSDYEYWSKLSEETHLPRTGDYFNDSVRPVAEAGRIELVTGQYEIEDGLWLDPMPGHSPGQVAVHIKSGNHEALLTSDILHHPLQLIYPNWSTNFCVDKSQARKTRRSLLEKYADSSVTLFPSHFPSPTGVSIIRDGEKFWFRYRGE